jgi:hypothetical protein
VWDVAGPIEQRAVYVDGDEADAHGLQAYSPRTRFENAA